MQRYWGVAISALSTICALTAQAQDTFKTRLSPVPIDAQLAPVITGHGSVSAVLSGTKLTVTGSFEGLRSAATKAQLYQSKMTGVRGIAIHEVLMVTRGTTGRVSGSVDLKPDEVDALRKGLLYVVIGSVGAPDGNLWGWLLK